MADTPIGNVATDTATSSDYVVGVKDGVFKRFPASPSFAQLTAADTATPSSTSTVLGETGGVVKRFRQDETGPTINVFSQFTDAERADALTGTPATDATAKIQAAIDAALTAGQRVVAYGTFRIGAAKLVIKGDCDFSDATFLVYGTPAVAIEVSTGNATDPTTNLLNKIVRLPKRTENMTKPATGWAAQGIGVRTVNCYSCDVHTGNIYGFARGFLPTSYGTGNVYNEYHIGHLENNEVNFDAAPGNASGWVNENNFYGGRYSHVSGEGTAVAGTRHIRLTKATNAVNNNVFIKPSIEGNVAEYHVENGGSYNTIFGGRWEATTPKVLYTGDNANQASRNLIIGGYNTHNIAYTYTGSGGASNAAIYPGGSIENLSGTKSFHQEGSSANPIHTFYEAGTKPESAGATDWSVKFGSQTLQGKRKADANPRLKLDFVNGRVYFDNGTTASPASYIGALGADSIAWTGALLPSVNDTYSIGSASYRWKAAHFAEGIGVHGATPPTSKPSVTGSRGGNAALASLLTALAACGLVSDDSSA